jgi:tetratricopeptide (TPR) repeat protein
MRGTRLIVRVPEDFPDDAPLLKSPRVRFRRFAIPADAGEMELKETVEDANASDAERMRALLQIAFIDLAYDRHKEATAGLRTTMAWHQKAGDLALQAVAMIGLGDCCRRGGDIDKAKYWYECAIGPAGAAKQMMPLSLIAQHLGAIAYNRKQFAAALAYFEQLVIVKRAITDEDGLVDALLWRGRAQEKTGKIDLALVSWEEAMLVARVFELGHREAECLEQMRKGFAAQGRAANADKAVKEWTMPPSSPPAFGVPAMAG